MNKLIRFGDFLVNESEVLYFWRRETSIQCYVRGNTIPIVMPCGDSLRQLESMHASNKSLIRLADYLVNPDNTTYFWQRGNSVQAFFPGCPVPINGIAQDNRLELITN